MTGEGKVVNTHARIKGCGALVKWSGKLLFGIGCPTWIAEHVHELNIYIY